MPYVCPRCKSSLAEMNGALLCKACNETYPLHDGIYSCITREKQKEIEPFLRQYKIIREAENRGSDKTQYYLRLPNVNTREWHIRRVSSQKALLTLRDHFNIISPDKIRIADIGAGNCWFTHILSERGYNAYAIDIFDDERDGLRAGKHYLNSSGSPFTRVAAHFDELPFAAGFFDAVIFNAALHYSKNQITTLQEAFRTLTHNGTVLVLDSPIYANRSSGEIMVKERIKYHERLLSKNAETTREETLSSSYLTKEDFMQWERTMDVNVYMQHVFYGVRWMLRPLIAQLRGRRQSASFALIKIIKR